MRADRLAPQAWEGPRETNSKEGAAEEGGGAGRHATPSFDAGKIGPRKARKRRSIPDVNHLTTK